MFSVFCGNRNEWLEYAYAGWFWMSTSLNLESPGKKEPPLKREPEQSDMWLRFLS